ncbi:uncharacterized protein LOC111286238 [Durio zibethinus]|uniref:Uncharacterized protein LOC111286238 n=1 Tax=Durio zibethinus TaxID=66656 RepID=A0A6P5XUG0_DURZI|nr:uncharacterized protein LOC111286238 [Durio zibethinus]
MDDQEFRRLLDLFPVVRPRDYHAELDSSRQSTSRSASNRALSEWQDAWNDGERKEKENQEVDLHDKFWQKLKLAAERKVGAAEADKFCKAFQDVHKKLVHEGLSFDAAQKFLNS